MEVFAEKMLAACQALLGVVSELRRNALLNDVAGRNAEVRIMSMGAAMQTVLLAGCRHSSRQTLRFVLLLRLLYPALPNSAHPAPSPP